MSSFDLAGQPGYFRFDGLAAWREKAGDTSKFWNGARCRWCDPGEFAHTATRIDRHEFERMVATRTRQHQEFVREEAQERASEGAQRKQGEQNVDVSPSPGSPETAAYVGFFRYAHGEPAIWMYRRVPFFWSGDYWKPMLDGRLFMAEAERIDEREYQALLDQHGATDARDVFPPMEPFDPSDWGDTEKQEKVLMPADPLPEYRRSKQ